MQTKTFRIFLLVLIIIGVVLLFTQKMWVPKLVTSILTHESTTTPSTSNSSIEGCYVAHLAEDVYSLKITSQNGENVQGTLAFKNFEKDSSSGTFKGTYKDRILLGDYSFNSEGMASVMQVIFKKIGNDFVRGYGEVNGEGSRFTDLNKITYDSSAVFKADPNCSSTSTIDTTGWKTFSDPIKGITFKYPAKISAKYISTVDWPPKIEVKSSPFTCTEAGKETETAGMTQKQTIGGKDYCVTKETEGAAGSIYTQYAYATEVQNKVVFLTFSLRFVQCGNYDDPQKTACEKERATFTIDPIISQIVQTINL